MASQIHKEKKPNLSKLCHALIERSAKSKWNEHERKQFITHACASYEGRGEKAIKERLGIFTPPSQASEDLPGCDVKCIISPNTPNKVNSIRLGSKAIKHLNDFRLHIISEEYEIAWTNALPAYSPKEHKELLLKNLLTHNLRNENISKLPSDIQTKLEEHLKLSRACDYHGIYLTAPTGFILVERADFDLAFKFIGSSQERLNYALNYCYIEKQLALQDVPNISNIHPQRHLSSEIIEATGS